MIMVALEVRITQPSFLAIDVFPDPQAEEQTLTYEKQEGRPRDRQAKPKINR